MANEQVQYKPLDKILIGLLLALVTMLNGVMLYATFGNPFVPSLDDNTGCSRTELVIQTGQHIGIVYDCSKENNSTIQRD